MRLKLHIAIVVYCIVCLCVGLLFCFHFARVKLLRSESLKTTGARDLCAASLDNALCYKLNQDILKLAAFLRSVAA